MAFLLDLLELLLLTVGLPGPMAPSRNASHKGSIPVLDDVVCACAVVCCLVVYSVLVNGAPFIIENMKEEKRESSSDQ